MTFLQITMKLDRNSRNHRNIPEFCYWELRTCTLYTGCRERARGVPRGGGGLPHPAEGGGRLWIRLHHLAHWVGHTLPGGQENVTTQWKLLATTEKQHFWASRIRIRHYLYGSFHHQAKKIVRKTLISTVLLLLNDFLSFKTDVNVSQK